MAEAKVVKRKRARVVLRGARTYQLAGRRFIKDVPQVIVGDDLVNEFQMNGYFHVTELDPVSSKKKTKKKASSGSKKKTSKKASSKGKGKDKGKVSLQK